MLAAHFQQQNVGKFKSTVTKGRKCELIRCLCWISYWATSINSFVLFRRFLSQTLSGAVSSTFAVILQNINPTFLKLIKPMVHHWLFPVHCWASVGQFYFFCNVFCVVGTSQTLNYGFLADWACIRQCSLLVWEITIIEYLAWWTMRRKIGSDER